MVEWDYGGYEGRTTRDIRAELGYNWSAFTHGVIRGATPGETVEEVAARASRVLNRVLPAMVEGDVALVAHGHFLRILTAVFLRMAPRFGAQITLDAGSVSVLSYYREQPAIVSWNYGLVLPLEPLRVLTLTASACRGLLNGAEGGRIRPVVTTLVTTSSLSAPRRPRTRQIRNDGGAHDRRGVRAAGPASAYT